jgi:hypothetical protein
MMNGLIQSPFLTGLLLIFVALCCDRAVADVAEADGSPTFFLTGLREPSSASPDEGIAFESIELESLETERDEDGERIETDRHDFTQSTTVIGRGVFQIETGYSFFRKSNAPD